MSISLCLMLMSVLRSSVFDDTEMFYKAHGFSFLEVFYEFFVFLTICKLYFIKFDFALTMW